MAKRIVSLMTVTALGGTAALANPDREPAPTVVAVAPRPLQRVPIQPRVLPAGAPACGNVMFKSYTPMREDALCPVFRNLEELDASGRNFERDLEIHVVGGPALTLAAAGRPRL